MKRSHSFDKHPPADEAAQAVPKYEYEGPKENNNCSICLKYKERLAQAAQRKVHFDEAIVETLLCESFRKLRLAEDRMLAPTTSAKSLTIEFLSGYLENHSGSTCDASHFNTCVVFFGIWEQVKKVFPDADASEFQTNVQQWLATQQDEEPTASGSSETVKTLENCCTLCLTKEDLLKGAYKKELKSLDKYFPKKPLNAQEMVDGFLNNYILKSLSLPEPLTLTKNCFGEKFKTCFLQVYIFDKVKRVFRYVTERKIYQITEDWFKQQVQLFEQINFTEYIEDIDKDAYDSLKGAWFHKIEVPTNLKKDANEQELIHWILDLILREYYLGFVLACGTSKQFPVKLGNMIHDIVVNYFFDLQRREFDDFATKWLESKI